LPTVLAIVTSPVRAAFISPRQPSIESGRKCTGQVAALDQLDALLEVRRGQRLRAGLHLGRADLLEGVRGRPVGAAQLSPSNISS